MDTSATSTGGDGLIPEIEDTEIIPGGNSGEAPLANTGYGDDFDVEVSQKDLIIPFLNLVAKTGGLSDSFTPGTFVYNRDVEVSDGKKPLMVIPLTMKKFYEEDIEYNPEIAPRRFATLEEAHAEGYTHYDDDKNAEKIVRSCAQITLLVPVDRDYATIEAPANLHEPIKEQVKRVFNGEPQFGYTRAILVCRKSAYKGVAAPLISAKTIGHLRGLDLCNGMFALTAKLDSFKTNTWWTPVLKSAGRCSPELAKWVKEEVMV